MARGQLRIFLGAAPGVGKTYTMLQEANRRAKRGADVVVGLVETYGRRHTQAMLGGLEVLPHRTGHRGRRVAHPELVLHPAVRQPDDRRAGQPAGVGDLRRGGDRG
jgi:two-component system sensor histidine kinase KdpD